MPIASNTLPSPLAACRRPLAAALLLALAAPGLAGAQAITDRERALEARVAELERIVQHLAAQQQATPVASAPPAPAATPGKPAIQTAPIMATANPNTRFSYGGFIKLDGSLTDTNDGDIADGSVGRTFYVPKAIPVGNGRADEGGGDLDMDAQYSRF